MIEQSAGSNVTPTLIAAYRATLYCVNGVSPPFLLRIDEPSADLDACQRAAGVECSAFLTAWNPASQLQSPADNAVAQARLEASLRTSGYRLIEGLGLDPTGQWEGEESFLVLGMPRAAACEVGLEFGQNGCVWADRDAVPRLVLLR